MGRLLFKRIQHHIRFVSDFAVFLGIVFSHRLFHCRKSRSHRPLEPANVSRILSRKSSAALENT